MGASLSWIAVHDSQRGEILKQLGLTVCKDASNAHQAKFFGYQLPGGWYVIESHRGDLTELNSVPGELAVACSVEEHVMVSIATGWTNGENKWRITHNSVQDIEHLDTEGALPECFAAIRDRLFIEQSESDDGEYTVDYIFDIPVKVAEALTGYNHNGPGIDDNGNDLDVQEEVLTRIRDTRGKVKASQLDDLPGSKGCMFTLIGIPTAAVTAGILIRSALALCS